MKRNERRPLSLSSSTSEPRMSAGIRSGVHWMRLSSSPRIVPRVSTSRVLASPGTPINRVPLVKLFASVLRREPDGSYWLVTPAERGRVTVEDAPFIAVAVDREGEGRAQRLIFRTNLDEIVTAGADHALRIETAADGAPAPYILVRPGIEARLARPAFYELVEWGDEETIAGESQFGVWSSGVFFRLGKLDEEA